MPKKKISERPIHWPSLYCFFKTVYEAAPVNLASITGTSHVALPYLKGHWALGRYYHVNRDGLLSTITQAAMLANTHISGACYFWLGKENALLITQPAHIKQVLIFNDANLSRNKGIGDNISRVLGNSLFFDTGATWRHKRTVWKHALFTNSSLKAYAPDMQCLASGYVKKLLQHTDAPIDLHQFFTEFTLDTIGRTLMAHELLPDIAEQLTNLLVEGLKAATSPSTIAQNKLLQLQKLLSLGRTPVGLDALSHSIKRFFNERVLSHTEETLKVTQCLLSTIYEFHGGFDVEGNEQDAIIGDALFLIFAGHNTTAATFQFAVKLLSANPDIATRLHETINQHLDGKPLTAETVGQIEYLDWVLEETLRLFPPVPIMSRGITHSFYAVDLPAHVSHEEYHVAARQWRDDAIYLAKGTSVVISPYVMHRSERFFHHPNDFIPERFSPENKKSIPEYAYIPFGVGPRACLGQRFAWQELKLLLAAIYSQCYIDVENNDMSVDPFDVTLSPNIKPMGQVRRFDQGNRLGVCAM